jgi:hypothetical protein
MGTILSRIGTKANGTFQDGGIARMGSDMRDAIKKMEKTLNETRTAITEKIDDAQCAAERMVKRSRHALEDGIEDTTHTIRTYPISSVAVGIAAGAALGVIVMGIVGWQMRSQRWWR